jgi:hypothetical protein
MVDAFFNASYRLAAAEQPNKYVAVFFWWACSSLS